MSVKEKRRRRRHIHADETPPCCVCGMVHIAGGCVAFRHFTDSLLALQHRVDELLEIERKRRRRAR